MTESLRTPCVHLERSDQIATVVIDRPDALNALNSSVLKQLSETFEVLRDHVDLRGVILTGSGEKAFVAGADIGELAKLTERTAREFCQEAHRTFRKIETLGKPVVAAVGGFALGGGCELALACHLRVASTDAQFGLPEVGLGAIPGFGGTVRLARLIGMGRALELIMTGRRVSSKEAEEIGLVNVVVPREELIVRSRSLLEEILRNGPLAVSAALESVYHGLETPLEDALTYESSLFENLVATDDFAEGMKAFLEKRTPRFRGS